MKTDQCLNEEYKVSSLGWLCVKFEPYKWQPLFKLEESQLKELNDVIEWVRVQRNRKQMSE